nr:hypothetical protein [uncultured bacterium]
MSKLTVCLFLIVGHFQCVTAAQEINQYDAAGKRHGVWQKTYESSKQLRYTGSFNHGKEIGVFKFFDSSGGHPTAIKEYTTDSPFVDVTFYTTEGKKVSSGKMKNRKRQGEWLSYHQDGSTIMIKEQYKNGLLDGQRNVFFISGLPALVEQYVDGNKEGKAITYTEEGKVLKSVTYKQDKLEGPAIFYNGYGEKEVTGNYKNNRKHGLWKYYKNGQVDKEIKYPRNKIGVQ